MTFFHETAVKVKHTFGIQARRHVGSFISHDDPVVSPPIYDGSFALATGCVALTIGCKDIAPNRVEYTAKARGTRY